MFGSRAIARKLSLKNCTSLNKYVTNLNGGFSVNSIREKSLTTGNYDEVHRNSIEKKEEFWDEVAQNVTWTKPYKRVLDPDSALTSPRWFPGGELNTCYNAVDRHVENGMGSQVAIIHDSPVTGNKSKITYLELQDKVSKLAGVMAKLGVSTGDTVLIYMPMVAEAVVAMLAASRIGAVHSVVFGGFAPPELAKRIDHLKPKVILIASCGIEPSRFVEYKPLLDAALKISHHKPAKCIAYQRPGLPKSVLKPGVDVDWQEEVEYSKGHDPVPLESNHPAYVLYTSGTTGDPKGIVRPTGGHTVVLPWTMQAIYGLKPSDVWWAASDLGWVVGHSYICYGPLLNGNTTVVYEGKPTSTPNSKQFYRVIEEHNVAAMFTAPTALRAIRLADPTAKLASGTSFKHLFVAGEALDHETRHWSEESFGVTALDHFWQTETGYAITAHCMGLNMNPNPPRGTTGKPGIGFDLTLLTSDGKEVKTGELGRIVSRLPLPPGCLTSLYEAHDRYLDTYFKQFRGYYDTMDAGMKDTENYISVLSREDDVINVAGHRLSTLGLEEALYEHPDVVEAAVIGVPDELKGVVPFGFVVVKKRREEEEFVKEVIELVRKRVGPVASFKYCAIVKGLPRTRSGKTPRGSIASLARGQKIKIPPTIEDHTVYSDIYAALKRNGFAEGAPEPLKE